MPTRLQTKSGLKQPAVLSVIIPVFNEESNLPFVLEEILPFCREQGWRLILVDDGSDDSTPALLDQARKKPGVKVLHHKVNQGYGGALKTGIRAVDTHWLVTMDADGQHDPADLKRLFEFAQAQDADLVIGRRSRQTGRAGVTRNLGKWFILRFASLLMPIHIHDLNSGLKLYRTDLARRYISICPDSMAFSDVITLAFIKKHHRVLEHPIQVRARRAGRSTINLLTAFQTLMEIINITMLFNPLRIFLPIAAVCMLFGFGWGIPIILQERGVSVGAMLAIVTGLLFIFIGLLAEQLSALRMSFLDENEDQEGAELGDR